MAKKRNIEPASVFERSGIRAIRARAIEVLLYLQNNLSDVDAAPTQSLPILDATRDSAEARGPSRRARLSCRHPDYEEEEARAQSFFAWPLQHDVQDVNNLAANGFFYTGKLTSLFPLSLLYAS